MLRNLLIVAAIGGNILVWTIAYIGFTRNHQSEDAAAAAKDPPVVIRSAQLRLMTLNIPTATREGQRIKKNVPVTVTLTLDDKHRVPYVCRLAPKIQDWALQFLYKYPPRRTAKGGLDFKPHIPHLLYETNKILQRNYVVGVEVAEATAAAGGGSARFFRMSSCQRLTDRR